jgi:hypothetical protein
MHEGPHRRDSSTGKYCAERHIQRLIIVRPRQSNRDASETTSLNSPPKNMGNTPVGSHHRKRLVF